MTVLREAVLASLTSATRARTALAACSWLSWAPELTSQEASPVSSAEAPDDAGRAPYFDSGGSPVLLVERRTHDALLDLGTAGAELAALPELGIVRLQGQLWPVAGTAYLEALRQFRLEHAECADCCGPRRTHLVGFRVERVEIVEPESGGLSVVDLDDYAAARPDPIITHSLSVRGHLNAIHANDLIQLAAQALQLPLPAVLAVTVDWIDAFGLEISVIDEDGAGTHRLPFRSPLTTMDDLGGQLHAFLRNTGGSC